MKKYRTFIDIYILNTNAQKTVRKIMRELMKLDYPKNLFLITVCDNNSTDGSKEMLAKEFPDVYVIPLKKNHGMSGLNYGFQKRKGELCFILDDDSYFQKDAVKLALEEFDRDQTLGILTCNTVNPQNNEFEGKYLPTHGKSSVVWCDFIGGGVIIRSHVFDDIGYFNPDILIYGHEVDFSLRALNAGWSIRFAPQIVVRRLSLPNKMNTFRMSLGVRNFPSVFFRLLSFKLAVSMTFTILVEYFLLAIRSRTIPAYIMGIMRLVHSIPYIIKNRQPVGSATERFWSSLYPFSPINTIRRFLGTYRIIDSGSHGKKLNLGCGNRMLTGYVNVDNNPLLVRKGIVTHDLNKFPYPFADNTFDEIRMDHVLEHLEDPLDVLIELYRIARNGCKVFIRCPHFSYGWVHPQHKSPISSWLFSYLDTHNLEHYGKTNFHVESIRLHWLVPADGRPFLLEVVNQIINFFANLHIGVTQRVFCYWVGGFEEISFVTTVEKPNEF